MHHRIAPRPDPTFPTDLPRRLALCALILASAPQGARFLHFVSPDGDDANYGSRELPFATVARAVSEAEPGDTILLLQGRHRIASPVRPVSGRSDRIGITIKPWADEEVLLDCGNGPCFELAGTSYLNFFGLRFTSSDTSPGASMVHLGNSRGIVFDGCEFFGMPAERGSAGTAAIRCTPTGAPDSAGAPNSDSCAFRENHFHDNASPAMRIQDARGWTVTNNTFANCQGAVVAKGETYDMVLSRNLVLGGGVAFDLPLNGGGRGVQITQNIVSGARGGVRIGGPDTTTRKRTDLQVTNNTFHDVRTVFQGSPDPRLDSGIRIQYNIASSDTAFDIPSGDELGASFVSFNKQGSTPTSSSTHSLDWNVYWMPASDRSAAFVDGGSSFANLADWQSGRNPFDAHSVSVDPQFVDVRNGDFHLRYGSPVATLGTPKKPVGAYTGDIVIGRHVSIATTGTLPVPARKARPDVPPDSRPTKGYRADGRSIGPTIGSGVVLPDQGRTRVEFGR